MIQRVNPYDRELQRDLHEQWFRDQYANIEQSKPKMWRDSSLRITSLIKSNKFIVATTDFETDPFDGVSKIEPFAVGFYNGSTYHTHWGDDAPQWLYEHVRELDQPHMIYAHNGGRFDFMFILQWLEPDIFCIGRRIVSAKIRGRNGIMHELRDSASLMPVPLKDAALKYEFDYSNMRKNVRHKHYDSIMSYLKQDCIGLYDTIKVGHEVVGKSLTMASAAMKQLNAAMPSIGHGKRAVEILSEDEDLKFRDFYFGGRVQCFERGIIEDDFKVYDITSSYPNVMKRYRHPISASFVVGDTIGDDTDFAVIDATSNGCLPLRAEDGRLSFPIGRHTFHASGHEIRTALSLGLLTIHNIQVAYTATKHSTFAPFIDKFFALRKETQEKLSEAIRFGDVDKVAYYDAMQLFFKLVMNGSYGKFAINPRKFKNYMIQRVGSDTLKLDDSWTLSQRYEAMDVYEQTCDSKLVARSYLNVCTGASITAAARCELMIALHNSIRPIYCDTDSIICKEFVGETGKGLGQWKLENECYKAAIVERKTYALFGEIATDKKEYVKRMKDYGDASCIKLASKGVRLTAQQILDAAMGDTVTYYPLAPTFRIDGSFTYTSRRIKMNHPA